MPNIYIYIYIYTSCWALVRGIKHFARFCGLFIFHFGAPKAEDWQPRFQSQKITAFILRINKLEREGLDVVNFNSQVTHVFNSKMLFGVATCSAGTTPQGWFISTASVPWQGSELFPDFSYVICNYLFCLTTVYVQIFFFFFCFSVLAKLHPKRSNVLNLQNIYVTADDRNQFPILYHCFHSSSENPLCLSLPVSLHLSLVPGGGRKNVS